MWQWIRDNSATIIISVILFAGLAAIAVKLIKDKKQGKSSCGAGCKSCALCGKCHGGCASPEEREKMMREAKQRLAEKEAARNAAKAAAKAADGQADPSQEKSTNNGTEK